MISGEAIAQAYTMMRYDAVGVGPLDLSGGLEFLKQTEQKGLNWTSVNLLNEDGSTVFPAYRIKKIGDLTFAFIGLTKPTARKGVNYTISNGQDELTRLLPELSQSVDLIVVLSSLSLDSNKSLAEQFVDIDVIFGADTSKSTIVPFQAGNSLIMQTDRQGKQIGILTLDWKNLPWGEPVSTQLKNSRARLKSITYQVSRLKSKQSQNNTSFDGKIKSLEDEQEHLTEQIARLETKSQSENSAEDFSSYRSAFVPIPSSGSKDPRIEALVTEAKTRISKTSK